MDNPFRKILDSFSSMGISSSGESALGVDIGTSAIKIVEIKKKNGKAMLETYGAISLGPYQSLNQGAVTNLPVEKIIEALKEVLKQSGVTSKSLALSIPVQSSLIFSMELPASLTAKEVNEIIPTEARKYIPIPITEVSLDYFEIPKKELSFEEANNPEFVNSSEAKKEVLVVAIQNDAISKSKAVVKDSGMSADFFEVEIFSGVRSCFEHELSLVLLIDIGASRTKLSFVEFGMVKNYHTINRGSFDMTSSVSKSLTIPFEKAEELKKQFGLYENTVENKMPEIIKVHTDYIFSETNNVLLKYEKKYNRTVSKIILTGGGSLMKGIKEEATNTFKAPVEVAHPFRKVGAPAFLQNVLDSTGPEFAVAIGLALRKLQ